MKINKQEDVDQCFYRQDSLYLTPHRIQDMNIDIYLKNYNCLPANELRQIKRPQNMVPRTFYLQNTFQLLPECLNQNCVEKITLKQQGKIKLKIVNSKHLTIQQYFQKSKFKCIYNKLNKIRQDSKTFTGRLKGIDSLIDYNQKLYKQLKKCTNTKNTIQNTCNDQIDSNFQSGNLCKAYINQQNLNQYYLLIQNDINTYGYNNWFFYRFKNTNIGSKRFTIINFAKNTNFFDLGMQISIFSMKKYQKDKQKWFKGGNNITFGKTNFIRDHHTNENYYFLSFDYQCDCQNDQIYFALNQPYTYTRLINKIEQIKNINPCQINVQIKNIGYTISNNILPCLFFKKNNVESSNIILIIARQHPCETVGSFITQNIMKILKNQSNVSNLLLDQYQFCIVPMCNPDGVIHGNSRCNMAGLDLNRQWGQKSIKQLSPQTCKIKQIISQLIKNKSIKYMIDLHGHGKKLNSFIFSCKGSEKDQYRLFSVAMKKLQKRFNLFNCTYGITQDKQNTIRSKINCMGISNSYTLQTSLYGWKNIKNQIIHFNQNDYQQIAQNLLKSIFLLENNPKITLQQIGLTKQMIMSQMSSLIQSIQKQQISNIKNNDILSQSDPDGDKLDIKDMLIKCQNNVIRKKIQDTYSVPKTKRNKNIQRNNHSTKNIQSTTKYHMEKHYVCQSNGFLSSNLNKSSNNRKTSLSQKWKEKRKNIQQKKKQEQLNELKRQISKLSYRNRQYKINHNKIIQSKQQKIAKPVYFNNKLINYKKKIYNKKVRTQFSQLYDSYIPTQQQIKQNQQRKSALQLKFYNLKQQSLNVLFTNSLSIQKLNTFQKINTEQKQGDLPQKITKNNLYQKKVKTQNLKIQQKDSVRLKKFKKFINSGISINQDTNNSSSIGNLNQMDIRYRRNNNIKIREYIITISLIFTLFTIVILSDRQDLKLFIKKSYKFIMYIAKQAVNVVLTVFNFLLMILQLIS